jgi:predicted 3-demethylubiquinone-9 3-methyltransferase (glyoxalase superfamily)
VNCETQEEVDYYWEKLSTGGDPNAQQCGWLKDKYGLSWQVVPTIMPKLMSDPDAGRSGRAMAAMLKMKKIDIAELQRAAAG